MKATLATLACLLTVGFLSAAEVTGNNTAVVIRKDVVKSNTGYQFLCVPVDGLDIANGTTTKVTLGTLLPAETLPAGTQLILVGGNAAGATYYADGSSWTDGENDAADIQLDGGQIFWLRYSNAKNASADTVIFCGQDRARTVTTPKQGVVTAMANDSSKAIALTEVVASPANLDTILVIQSGSSDYKQYNYFGGVWYGPNGANANTDTIAPGEAFYYFKRSN